MQLQFQAASSTSFNISDLERKVFSGISSTHKNPAYLIAFHFEYTEFTKQVADEERIDVC